MSNYIHIEASVRIILSKEMIYRYIKIQCKHYMYYTQRELSTPNDKLFKH